MVSLLMGLRPMAGVSHAADFEVSIVLSRSISPYLKAIDGIRNALSEAGPLSIDVRDMGGDVSAGARIADDLARHRPNLIITVGSEATRAIAEAVHGIPIVFTMVVHPETLIGDRKSMTGVSMEVPLVEQLRWLHALLPNIRRLGLIYSPSGHPEAAVARWREAARQLELDLAIEPVSDAKDIPKTLRTLLPTVEAFWLIPDETLLSESIVRQLILETLRQRIPVLAPSWRFVEEGALLAVSCDYQDVGRQAGELAVRLLRGEPAMDAQILEARKSRLQVNLKVAETLGLTVPKPLLDKADRVYR